MFQSADIGFYETIGMERPMLPIVVAFLTTVDWNEKAKPTNLPLTMGPFWIPSAKDQGRRKTTAEKNKNRLNAEVINDYVKRFHLSGAEPLYTIADKKSDLRASARIKYTQMTPDFCSPILYKIRQGASDSATLLVVISDATQDTDKKTSKIVYFILAEVLNIKRIAVVHGEADQSLAFAERLRTEALRQTSEA